MKKLLLTLALILVPSFAWAQCNGIFPNNTACGNITGSSNTPRPVPLSSFPANLPGGTNGQIQYNNGGAFGGYGPCATLNAAGVSQTNGVACNALRIATTSPVTMTTADGVVVVNLSAAGAVTLPASPSLGIPYLIKDGSCASAVNNITITPASGNIDNATNYILAANCGAIEIMYNGTQWIIL